MAISSASTVREFLHRELVQTGYCDVVVASEFEWKATRRLSGTADRDFSGSGTRTWKWTSGS